MSPVIVWLMVAMEPVFPNRHDEAIQSPDGTMVVRDAHPVPVHPLVLVLKLPLTIRLVAVVPPHTSKVKNRKVMTPCMVDK
jgi:hypothetical protein